MIAVLLTVVRSSPRDEFQAHCRKFSCPDLSDERLQNFIQRLSMIKKHNENPNKSFTMGVNAYTVLFDNELKHMKGYSKTKAHAHSQSTKNHHIEFDMKSLKSVSSSEIPSSFSWTDKHMVGVTKDQGQCGSCWANAATSVFESHVAINSGKMYSLSVQQFASCAPNPSQCGGVGGCEGSTAELAYEYLASVSTGMYQEMQYPYNSNGGKDFECYPANSEWVNSHSTPKVTLEGYTSLKSVDTQTLQQIVMNIGPVAVNVDASQWHLYESGVFDLCDTQKEVDINHVVTLVGWGTEASSNSTMGSSTSGNDYWLIMNSWSPDYGEKGFIKLKRTATDATDNCKWDTTPEDGVECAAGGDPPSVQVCGQCGVLYDIAYPVGAKSLI